MLPNRDRPPPPAATTAAQAAASAKGERRGRAIAGAKAAVTALRAMGVEALVTGSLVEGDFQADSDIDLLVIECPGSLKYAIEGVVEDCLMGLAFDVVYLDEVPPHKLSSFVGKARDVGTLG